MESAVTPDDVRRAVRLLYESFAADPHNRAEPFEKWASGLRGKRRIGDLWMQFAPDDLDPEAYSDFAPDDAALLLKVAAVVRAVKFPPD